MNVWISVEHNNYRLDGTLAFMNVGEDVTHLRLYGGTRPAGGGSAGSSPLVDIPLPSPPGTRTGNKIVLAGISDALVLLTGAATWARIVNGDGDIVLDCDVSDTAGTGEIKLESVALYAGGVARVLSAEFT